MRIMTAEQHQENLAKDFDNFNFKLLPDSVQDMIHFTAQRQAELIKEDLLKMMDDKDNLPVWVWKTKYKATSVTDGVRKFLDKKEGG